MSRLVFHERVGLEGRRISPFSWRVRYALAHKGLEPDIVPTHFADVDRIRALSGQDLVPIIEHGGQVVHDSWAIACHLERAFPDRPALFGAAAARAVARHVNHWSDITLHRPLRRLIYADFIWCLDPNDRAHFRRTREALLGETLEAACADRERWGSAFMEACEPLERTLGEQSFLAGASPAYVDHIVFSVFQWARIASPREILPDGAAPAIRDWRARMIALHDNLGDRFPRYPAERAGADGREAG